MREQTFLKGVSPVLQVIYAIEQFCDLTEKTDEYRDWLISVVKELEQGAK
jgi:hypothetical protein